MLRVGGDERSVAALLDGIERKLPPLARIDRDREPAVWRRAAARISHRRECGRRRAYAGRPGCRDLSGMHRRVARSAAAGDSVIRSPIAPIAARASASSPRSPTTGRRPRWRNLRSAMTCRAEYRNPDDRRFHAEPIACPTCGPTAALVALDDAAPPLAAEVDAIEAAAGLIRARRDRRGQGPRRLSPGLRRHQCRRGCAVAPRQAARRQAVCADGARPRSHSPLLRGQRRGRAPADAACRRRSCCCAPTAPGGCPETIAPGLRTLGFMLPTTPLHLLLLCGLRRPLVMTSGNLSDEPTVIDDDDARRRLGGIAAYALIHDRTDRQSRRRFGRSHHGREVAPAAARPRLRAGASQASRRLRARPRAAGDGRRAQDDLLPGQGRPGDPVAASGRP